jgi:hydroxymethylbilane synthase
LRPNGSQWFEARRSGACAEAAALGADAGAELKHRAPADFFLHG